MKNQTKEDQIYGIFKPYEKTDNDEILDKKQWKEKEL